MESTVLSFENVSKSYGEIRALESLTFSVRRNEVVALLGPNGAGKTTAIEIAIGLRGAGSGEVRLFGASPRRAGVRRRLGVTPQESGFPDMLCVDEIVAFAAASLPNGPRLDSRDVRSLWSRRARKASRRDALGR